MLDGAEQIIPGTLTTLQELISEREIRLPDNRHLVSMERFVDIMKRDGLSESELRGKGFEPIHPAFRVVGENCF